MVAKSRSSSGKDSTAGSEASPRSLSDQITKLMEGMKLPGIDAHALLESQRKNIDALLQATQIAAEGARTVSQRQAEILQEAFRETERMIQDLRSSGQPQDAIAKQSELVRRAFESALSNARELAQMIERSNTEAFNVMRRRMNENLDEIRKTTLKSGS
jgi:phasin family protein